MLLFGGDPRSKGKEAARIAKEIGDAVKEYAQAGGDNANAALTSNAQPQQTASSSGQNDATRSVTDAATVSTETSSSAEENDASATMPNGQAVASTSKSADQTFITEARLLANQAKAILKSAILEGKKVSENGAKGDNALIAIDQAAFVLGLGRGVGSDISAGYGAKRPIACCRVDADCDGHRITIENIELGPIGS